MKSLEKFEKLGQISAAKLYVTEKKFREAPNLIKKYNKLHIVLEAFAFILKA